jgi:hypothetical protein
MPVRERPSSLVRLTLFVAVLASALAVVLDAKNNSNPTPLEQINLGYEGCLAYGPSLENCPPGQLEFDRQLVNSLTDEEWNSLPQELRGFWGPLRGDSSEVLYGAAGA